MITCPTYNWHAGSILQQRAVLQTRRATAGTFVLDLLYTGVTVSFGAIKTIKSLTLCAL